MAGINGKRAVTDGSGCEKVQTLDFARGCNSNQNQLVNFFYFSSFGTVRSVDALTDGRVDRIYRLQLVGPDPRVEAAPRLSGIMKET